MRCRIVVLISGRGSNLQALINAVDKGFIQGEISAVISSREAAEGLQLIRKTAIPRHVLPVDKHACRADYDQALSKLIDQYSPDLVALAGFMRILSDAFVHRYAGRLINIHPSRLPRHRGLNTHQKVLQAGDRDHGASVHFVTPELDGGPVILQSRLAVLAKHSRESLAADVLEQEHIIYPQVVRWFCEARLRLESGRIFFNERPLTTPLQLDKKELLAGFNQQPPTPA